MQKQLLSDFLFVDGRSFQHSIIVILKVFQGSAQSYKTEQKSRFYWYKKRHRESNYRQILEWIACGIMSYFSIDHTRTKSRVQARFWRESVVYIFV